jgi:hypothetical protein
MIESARSIRFYIPGEYTSSVSVEEYGTEGCGGGGYKVKSIIGCSNKSVVIEHLDGRTQVFSGFPFVAGFAAGAGESPSSTNS